MDEIEKMDPVSHSTPASISNFSLSYDAKKVNSDYMKAVENGDMETAQRLVDEVAKRAEYLELDPDL